MKTSIQFLRPLAQRTVPIFAFSMRALPRTTRYPFQPSVAAFSIIGDAISGFANKRVEATKGILLIFDVLICHFLVILPAGCRTTI